MALALARFCVWLMAGIVNIHKGKIKIIFNLAILKDIVTVSFFSVSVSVAMLFGRQSFGFDLNLFNFHYYYFL